jgi:2-polyprenyl-3-methyl-5-hydroxy-6-metoxy-1,4-benzoquinol methylase
MIKKLLKPFLSRPSVARRVSKGILIADNFLDKAVNELLPYSESGVHPKHRLMNYHQFFVDNVSNTDSVLDIGCGQGMVAADIAKKAKRVVGIDFEAKKIAWAQRTYNAPNLTFIVGDALKDLPNQSFDVVVLSNVLEHIDKREEFLRSIQPLARTFLIRVPMITRDWKVLYKKEIGLDYRLDDTHFIEYTQDELLGELTRTNYRISSLTVRFGEFWVVAEREN